MNRHQYRTAYREARKFARFIETFHFRLARVDTDSRTFARHATPCPGFSHTRLFGDALARMRPGRALVILRLQRKPRLP